MLTNINLTEIEKKAFKSTFEDGLWDIMLGLIILAVGIIPLLSAWNLGDFWTSMLLIPFYILGYSLFTIGKRRITVPRMGLLKPGLVRRRKLKMIQVYLMAFLALGVIAGFIFFKSIHLAEWLPPAFLTILVFTGFMAGAYYLDHPRLSIYGIILTVSVPAGEILFRKGILNHHGYPAVFGLAGSIMIITGIILFVRFLHNYPLPEEVLDDK